LDYIVRANDPRWAARHGDMIAWTAGATAPARR